MNAGPENDARDGRLEGLLAEAQEAVAYSANALRSVRERFREAHLEQAATWERLRDELTTTDRRDPSGPMVRGGPAGEAAAGAAGAAEAAEAGAQDARTRVLRRDEAMAGRATGADESALARLDLAIRSLESAWLFLDPDDASLVADPGGAHSAVDLQMRVVEAQEAERTRLAREVHDGPAQALSNAIFQVEIVQRQLARDPVLAATELRLMRDYLRRELGDVRAFISQLRPPILADLGLEGAIRDAAEQAQSILGIPVGIALDPDIREIGESAETVVLRIVQEALHNVRKHADAGRVSIRVGREGQAWAVEVQDDGRGFDVGAVAARGRRNFGLQSMRERAELIGARFEVRSRPDGGTIVRIEIPRGTEESR